MVAEIIPSAYDAVGKRVFKLYDRLHVRPTFAMARYMTQPVKFRARTLDEMRAFLASCRYVSDEEQFGKPDYWMPPEEFESRRRGDCDDFAIWTWRQLVEMGKHSRFVAGVAGRYATGHAWVTFREGDRTFLVEPLLRHFGPTRPRLSTVRYCPAVSVAWDGTKAVYFEHEQRTWNPGLTEVLGLLPEWLSFKARTRARVAAARTRRLLGRTLFGAAGSATPAESLQAAPRRTDPVLPDLGHLGRE